MYYQRQLTWSRVRSLQIGQVLQWMYRRWFQIFVIGLILHVVFNKDISIKVNVKDAHPKGEVVTSSMEHSRVPVQAGMNSLFGLFGSPAKKSAPAETTADYFQNLSFILDPNLISRYGISNEVVDQKLENCRQFVGRFAKVAIAEREKYGVPASIILASSLLATDAGASALATEANNFFGLSCLPDCMDCQCKSFEVGQGQTASFEVFETPWHSFRAFSLALQHPALQALKGVPIDHYSTWAKELGRIQYPADEWYAEKIIRIIEKLDLFQFDR